jgi:hypothetical protein
MLEIELLGRFRKKRRFGRGARAERQGLQQRRLKRLEEG